VSAPVELTSEQRLEAAAIIIRDAIEEIDTVRARDLVAEERAA